MGESAVASTPPQKGLPEKVTYSEWITSRLWVEYGVPFSFEGRPYLKKIHDLDERKILFRTARQVEKTSTEAAKLVSWSCLRPGWRSLYVSPSQKQTRVFSHSRLDRVMTSPYVRSRFFDPKQCVDDVYEKTYLNGSTVWLSYANTNADRCLTGDAMITLADGREMPLEEIVEERKVGLEILTFSDTTKKLRTARITGIHMNGRRVVGRLRLKNGKHLDCTADHRVYVQAQKWRDAGRAHRWTPMNHKLSRIAYVEGGSIAWPDAVDFEEVGTEEVFDLTVSNDHAYIANGIVVHNCRGISSDLLLADEIQDMVIDVFPVLEETLSHAANPYQMYAGTPKTTNNSMEAHWKNSTQCEWLVHCLCGEWVYQDERVIRKEGPTCPKCGKLINPMFGKWEPYGKIDAEFAGFRIPQTIVPWIAEVPHKWSELVRKSEKWPQQQFYNEVLGLAHEKGANPLTESDIKKCCSERGMYEHRPADLYFDALYAGVDWGAGIHSYTLFFIIGQNSDKLHVLYAKRFAEERGEPGAQVDEIARMCQRFGVAMVGCDWGGGFVQNHQLALDLTGHADVIQFYESGTKKRDITYEQKSRLYVFNRNAGLYNVIEGIKNGQYVFPKWEQFQEFASDFTCVFEDYNTALRMMTLDHPSDMPDDALHALLFATCTFKVARGMKAFS